MAVYQTILIDGRTGGEGRYKFTATDDLMERTPVRAMRAFMESVEAKEIPQGHQDYEINAAIKSLHHDVITTLGVMHLTNGDQAPFMAMISKEQSPQAQDPSLHNNRHKKAGRKPPGF